MEKKLKKKSFIEIPEGYEVDSEKSVLDCIILKPIEKEKPTLYSYFTYYKDLIYYIKIHYSPVRDTLIDYITRALIDKCIEYIPNEVKNEFDNYIRNIYYKYVTSELDKPILSVNCTSGFVYLFIIFHSDTDIEYQFPNYCELFSKMLSKGYRCTLTSDK